MDERKVRQLFYLTAGVLAAGAVFCMVLDVILGILFLLLAILLLLLVVACSRKLREALADGMHKGREKLSIKPGTQEVDITQHVEYQLVVDHDGKISCFPIAREEYLIGRDPSCDLQIPQPMVARRQCKIIYRRYSKTYYIEDLFSKNGTFLGSRRLEPNKQEKLLENAEINIAGNTYWFMRINQTK